MMKHALSFLWIAALLVGLAGCIGCGDDDPYEEEATDALVEEESDAPASDGEPQSIAEAMAQAGQAMQEAQNALGGAAAATEAVDFRRLKDLLPEELVDLERTSSEGQRNKVMGIQTSEAEGTYEGGDARIVLKYLDMGTMRSLAMFGFAWAMTEMDRESDTGFERTVEYEGFPAYEKCERSGERMRCSYQIIIGERFIASLDGTNVTRAMMEAAREDVPVRRLNAMRDEGVPESE